MASRCSVFCIFLAVVGCGSQPDPSSGDGIEEQEAPLLAGRRVSQAEVARLLRSAGFREAAVPKMVCAAKYESAFFAQALGRNRNGSKDYGLFQINDYYWADQCGVYPEDLYDLETNVACAKTVYDHLGVRGWYGYQKHADECSSFVIAE